MKRTDRSQQERTKQIPPRSALSLDSGVLMLNRERSRRSGELYEVGGIVYRRRALDIGDDQLRRGKAVKKKVGKPEVSEVRTLEGTGPVQEIEKWSRRSR
jgi:hypothetical protein